MINTCIIIVDYSYRFFRLRPWRRNRINRGNGAIQATYYYDAFRNITEDTYTGDQNDPLSLNLYTYCHNEPVMYYDPSGHTDAYLSDLAEAAGVKAIWNSERKVAEVTINGVKKEFKTSDYKNVKGKIVIDNEKFDSMFSKSTSKNPYVTYSIDTTVKNGQITGTQKVNVNGYNQTVSVHNQTNNYYKDTNKPKQNENVTKGSGKIGNIDLSKLKPEDVTRKIAEWLIGNPVNVLATQHPYITKALTGVDVLALFYAGGFVMDGNGIYRARQEWSIQSFKYSGYNDFYDEVFHYATDMDFVGMERRLFELRCRS